MSVMQRKLFANKEARTKLRDMGGIMSSFPELSGEVQRFQDGMMVEAPRPPTGPTLMDRLQSESLLRETPRLSLDQATRRLLDAGMAPEELQQYVDQGIDLNYLLAQLPPETPPMRSPAEEEVKRINRSRIAGTTTGTPIYEQAVELLPPTPTEEGPAPAEEEAAPTTEQRIADLLPTPAETPDPTTDETGGGETGTPDLRARAEERIKLFQDLFGSDEPTARDRAMQFAMIGLAIAAGQSPNALTNIASGLLAGTQAMTAQEAERRKGARELRASALESVLQEQQLDRRLGAEVIQRDRRTAAELAKMRTDAYQEALTAADDGKALDYDPNTETPQQYAARKADALVKFYLQSLGAGAPTGANEYWNPETGEVVYWDGNAWVPKNG